MRRVMIRCPNADVPVATEFMSSPDVFADLRFDAIRLVCPECGETHVWGRANAFLEDGPPLATPSGDCVSEFRIDVAAGVVQARLRGRCTMEDIQSFRRRMHAHADYRPDMPLLIDARELTQLLPIADMHELVEDMRDGPLRDTGRRAVVTNSALVAERMRLFAEFAEGTGQTFRVFGDVPSALAWLTSTPDIG